MQTDWVRVVKSRAFLLPGATEATVAAAEKMLGVSLPSSLRDFLRWADGGQLAGKTIIVYSAGIGLCSDETLVSANTDREPGYPLLNIGRDATNEFGFLKTDLTKGIPPVYFLFHETGELDRVAESFVEFIMKYEH